MSFRSPRPLGLRASYDAVADEYEPYPDIEHASRRGYASATRAG